MKKFIILFFAITSYGLVFSQNNNGISIEADAGYYYHFMGGNTNNNFNYSFSLLLSNTFGKVKVSAGMDYSTKFYYYTISDSKVQSTNHLVKRNYQMEYLNFPFLIQTGVMYSKQFNISIVSGLVLNKLLHYRIISYFSDKPPFEEEPRIPKSLGLSLRIGINFSKPIGKHILFNVSPFTDIKMVLNGNNDDPNYNVGIPDNRFSIGLKIGIEYAFK